MCSSLCKDDADVLALAPIGPTPLRTRSHNTATSFSPMQLIYKVRTVLSVIDDRIEAMRAVLPVPGDPETYMLVGT